MQIAASGLHCKAAGWEGRGTKPGLPVTRARAAALRRRAGRGAIFAAAPGVPTAACAWPGPDLAGRRRGPPANPARAVAW